MSILSTIHGLFKEFIMHSPDFVLSYTDKDEHKAHRNPLRIDAVVTTQFNARIGSYQFNHQQLFDDCSTLIEVAIDIPFVRQLSNAEPQSASKLLGRYVSAWCGLIESEWMRADTLSKYSDCFEDYLHFCHNECNDVVNFHEWMKVFLPTANLPTAYDCESREDYITYIANLNESYIKDKELMLSVLAIFDAILPQQDKSTHQPSRSKTSKEVIQDMLDDGYSSVLCFVGDSEEELETTDLVVLIDGVKPHSDYPFETITKSHYWKYAKPYNHIKDEFIIDYEDGQEIYED